MPACLCHADRLYGKPGRGLDSFHVVGGQHARLAGSLDRAVHPAFIDRLYVYYRVAIFEGNLISVSRHIVVHGPVGLLLVLRKGRGGQRKQETRSDPRGQH